MNTKNQTNTAPVNAVVFPTTIEALTEFAAIAIERFQGSPVANKNKLNESIAAGLRFGNYDQLSAALKQNNTEPSHVHITYVYLSGDDEVKIGDDDISSAVFNHELVDYRVREREELIESILDMVSEAKPSDRVLMKQDIRYLESLNDYYVFSSISTNEYIASSDNRERYNEICDEIREAQAGLASTLTTDQLFELITEDAYIKEELQSAAEESSEYPWDVIHITDTVKSAMNLDLDLDDTTLFGRLLTHFNAEQARLYAEFNAE